MRRKSLKIGRGIIGSLLFLGLMTSALVAETEKRPFEGQTITVTCWTSDSVQALTPVIAEFEQRTGAKVNIVPAWTGFAAKIELAPENQLPWDVVMTESMEHMVLRKKNLILPIREENIPNLEKTFPAVRQMIKDLGGYGIIIGGEPIAPVYNSEKITFRPTTWADLLRPELKGKVSISKDYWVETLYQAAYMLHKEKGANEIYTDLDAVYRKAAELARHCLVAYVSGEQFNQLITRGDIVIAPYYTCTAARLKHEYGLIDGYLPEEGYVGYTSIVSVVKGTPYRDLAEAWINELLTEKAQRRLLEVAGDNWPGNRYLKEPAWAFTEEYAKMGLTSNEDWENFKLPDYEYFVKKGWDELEERYRKEVLSQVGKGG